MLYRIVGIDPGLETGICSFTVSYDGVSCVDSYELDLVGVGRYFEEIRIADGVQTHFAYEVANKFQASGHMSSEVIGLMRYFAAKSGVPFHPVSQSGWKRLISRDILKLAGLHVKGTHAKDAAGIGLYTAVSSLKVMQNVLRPEEA